MFKRGLKLSYAFLRFFTTHPWIKLISLVLAVIVWLYVRGEMSRFNY